MHPFSHTDPREGGAFCFLAERAGNRINHVSTYLEMKPYEKRVFTWGMPVKQRKRVRCLSPYGHWRIYQGGPGT